MQKLKLSQATTGVLKESKMVLLFKEQFNNKKLSGKWKTFSQWRLFFCSSPYLCFSPYAFAASNPSLIYIFRPHFLEIILYKLNIYHAPYILTPCWTASCCSTGYVCACIISPNINQASLLGNSVVLTHSQHSKNNTLFPSIF